MEALPATSKPHPFGQAVTLKAVAEQAEVSVTTVSRVLNGKAEAYRIKGSTAAHVRQTADALGYSPNRLARSLRTNATQTLGLVVPDIANPFFATVASNIEKVARARGYNLVLCDSEEDTASERAALDTLLGLKVDGLIVCPVGQESGHLRAIEQAGRPVVLVDRNLADLDYASVVSDDYAGAASAVTYLTERGHTRIGCIQGLQRTSTAEERVQGYRDAMDASGLVVDESLIAGDSFQGESGFAAAAQLLRLADRPTALFVGSSLILLGALRAIKEAGLRVPEDVSIVSFDEQPYSALLATPITTVSQQISRMGQIATELVIEHVERGSAPRTHVKLPTTLIERDSVRTLDSNRAG